MRLVIIGGSDAGISAALRARECRGDAEITVILADAFPNYSICGLPFYLSGEVSDWRALAHRTEFDGMTMLQNHRAHSIDPAHKQVRLRSRSGETRTLSYDKLLIATGARPVVPAIRGFNLPGVYPLHSMESGFEIQERLVKHQPRSVIIIGSGYIGVEMTDSLTRRGLAVTLVGKSEAPLPSVDLDFGHRIRKELEQNGVSVVNDTEIESITANGSHLVVRGSRAYTGEADIILFGLGVQPSGELAAVSGITSGEHGAIRVDRTMRTAIPDIFAAGDCVETWHGLLGEFTYLPLGTTAHKQGRIAGENMCGGNREFQGSVGTQVVKVFGLAVARTGLQDASARRAGFDPLTVQTTAWDHKAYYPGASEIQIRVTGDRRTGRLLGAQLVGPYQAQVAKRIDIFASALFHAMRVEDLNDLDLSYTPPLSSPWDPVQVAAQSWSQANAIGQKGDV